MVDVNSILIVIPPIITSVLTYIIASKKSKISQIQTITDFQTKAIEMVQKSEEQMRNDLKTQIERISKENKELKEKIQSLENQRTISDGLVRSLRDEVTTLKDASDHYKKIIDENKITMESYKKEIDYLRELTFSDENGHKSSYKKKIKE